MKIPFSFLLRFYPLPPNITCRKNVPNNSARSLRLPILTLHYINVKSYVREKELSKQDLNWDLKKKITVFGGHISNVCTEV